MRRKGPVLCSHPLLRIVARKEDTIFVGRRKKDVAKSASRCKDAHTKLCISMHQEAIAESRQDEEIQEGVIQKHEARNTKLTEDLIKLGNENKELNNEAKIYKVILEAKVTENVKLEETNAFYQNRLFPTLTSAPAATHRQDSVSMMGGGGNRGPSPAHFTGSPDI